ncbi:sigma-70 family RNA polymerase sigma factor [Brevibacillus laterosporus]|uniref:sigma-70 family RNA polymerase sigma factor n=1 Tax=Brevibacillus laterosporus TaxID=1465 RepID=UPI000E6CC340|nr:sigma-70 family RNA polymerase sigma factor [Brevibacillus laterosporus]AYB39694.1 sigma-70 family RNA polymerase sigma factor [Brevibacillus laterosporus]MBM7109119.1 positive control sigma-like factor [Brevibacillus laterosporus]
MEDLLREYEYTKMQLETKRRLLKKENTSKDELKASDIELLGEMISSVDFIIEWIKTGKRPGMKRGIERRAAYQREVLMDPLTLQSHINRTNAGSPANITDSQREDIEKALSCLTDREKECYIMAHGQGLTQYAIAELIEVSRYSVKTHIQRAQKKISKELNLKKEVYHLSKNKG